MFQKLFYNLEEPKDMLDQLGGWSLQSVGQGYGDGYDLVSLVRTLEAIVTSPK